MRMRAIVAAAGEKHGLPTAPVSMPAWWLVCMAALGFPTASANVENAAHKYCIIGAGPAGVQLGEFLFQDDIDYIIVEKAAHAGSFFATLPVHRNKR